MKYPSGFLYTPGGDNCPGLFVKKRCDLPFCPEQIHPGNERRVLDKKERL
jgi:UDP-N-acetyl-D-mannosaminuronate dehydrogenase